MKLHYTLTREKTERTLLTCSPARRGTMSQAWEACLLVTARGSLSESVHFLSKEWEITAMFMECRGDGVLCHEIFVYGIYHLIWPADKSHSVTWHFHLCLRRQWQAAIVLFLQHPPVDTWICSSRNLTLTYRGYILRNADWWSYPDVSGLPVTLACRLLTNWPIQLPHLVHSDAVVPDNYGIILWKQDVGATASFNGTLCLIDLRATAWVMYRSSSCDWRGFLAKAGVGGCCAILALSTPPPPPPLGVLHTPMVLLPLSAVTFIKQCVYF